MYFSTVCSLMGLSSGGGKEMKINIKNSSPFSKKMLFWKKIMGRNRLELGSLSGKDLIEILG